MVDATTVLRLVGGAVLLLSNGFFVTTEFALTRVRQFPEEEFRDGGLRRAWEMTERLEIYLSGCQLGITVSSVGLGVVAEPAVAAVLDPAVRALGFGTAGTAGHTAAAVIVALAVINLLHVVVGEQAPTYLGIERTKLVAKYGAPPLYWWTKATSPVIVVADRVAKGTLSLFGVDITRSWADEEPEGEGPPDTRGELRRRMGDTLRAAGLPDERREEVLNALEIGARPVEGIMVDRDDVVALSTADGFGTNLDRMASSPHVRFPLVGERLEEFHGIVYTPDLLRQVDEFDDGVDLCEVAAPPMTTTPDATVSDLIDRFQAENQELALVLDAGEVVGLATTTDAFEAIAGELEDPMDVRAERAADGDDA
ncbi:MAG: CNNM domain-containing protein [Haloferacaceae archaeon]